MKYETKQARTARHLKDDIPQGWLKNPNECPSDLKEFWNFREDLMSRRPYPKGTLASDPE